MCCKIPKALVTIIVSFKVSRIAFSSCYKPERVANKGSTFWSSVRREKGGGGREEVGGAGAFV